MSHFYAVRLRHTETGENNAPLWIPELYNLQRTTCRSRLFFFFPLLGGGIKQRRPPLASLFAFAFARRRPPSSWVAIKQVQSLPLYRAKDNHRTMSVFMIVGRNEPLYEADLSFQGGGNTSSSSSSGGRAASSGEESAHLNQFIVHSSLDMVDRKQWSTPAT